MEENGCAAQWRSEHPFSDYTPEREWRSMQYDYDSIV